MQGVILNVGSAQSLILGDDGVRYTFTPLGWQNQDTRPQVGMRVDFEVRGSHAVGVHPIPGAAPTPPVQPPTASPAPPTVPGGYPSQPTQPPPAYPTTAGAPPAQPHPASQPPPTKSGFGTKWWHWALSGGTALVIVGVIGVFAMGIFPTDSPSGTETASSKPGGGISTQPTPAALAPAVQTRTTGEQPTASVSGDSQSDSKSADYQKVYQDIHRQMYQEKYQQIYDEAHARFGNQLTEKQRSNVERNARRIAERYASAYAEKYASGKSHAFAEKYAELSGGNSSEYATAYAEEFVSSWSKKDANTFAKRIENGGLKDYFKQRDAGKSHIYARTYAEQIDAAKSSEYAAVYAEQIDAGNSPEHAAAYAEQIDAGSSPERTRTLIVQPDATSSSNKQAGLPTAIARRPATTTDVISSTLEGPCDARSPKPIVMSPPDHPSPETDREALEALFNATNGESWDEGGNWLGRISIDQWRGVTTNTNGRVIGLDLTGLNGTLPREIGNLSALEWLIIGSSPAVGELPPEVGNLSNLIHLEIDGGVGEDGGLTGKLPAEIGSLGRLEQLIIRNNYQLTGGLPEELGSLSKLKRLDLGHNELCGSLPPEIGNLSNLNVLALDVNRFSGNIPVELGSLIDARFIYLGDNQFTDALPEALEYLTNTGIHLTNTNFTAGRGKDFQGNQFSGCLSDYMIESGILINLPDNLQKCSPEDHEGDVETLIALYNAWDQPDWENWLGRASIGEWEGVSVDSSGRVAALALDLEARRLPDELGNLTALRELSLEDASGEIPEELGNLVNLRTLALSRFNRTGRTELSGEIPEALGNLSNLLTLNLEANQLTGAIPPELGNLSNLRHLSLTFNKLSGELPTELGKLTNLQTMGLKHNDLSGCVPASLDRPGIEFDSIALDFC